MTRPEATPLSDLRERVERAEGPDLELDADIWVLAAGDAAEPGERRIILERDAKGNVYRARLSAAPEPPSVTASIDAALALVERVLPNTCWRVGFEPDSQGFRAELVTPPPYPISVKRDAASPPLAILAALLQAMEQQQ